MENSQKCDKCKRTIPLIATNTGYRLADHKRFASYTKQIKCECSGQPKKVSA